MSRGADPRPEVIALTDDERRALTGWAADCAARVLPLFEARVPGDQRPRAAIAGALMYAQGGKRTAQLRTLGWAALASAKETSDPVAAAAARAASGAAGAAFIHALATPHQVRHIVGPPAAQVQACEIAAGGDPAAGDRELLWAIEHAPDSVCDVLRRLPAGRSGRGRPGEIARRLEEGLRHRASGPPPPPEALSPEHAWSAGRDGSVGPRGAERSRTRGRPDAAPEC